MNRALGYLLLRKRSNGLRQFARGLSEPKRLIGTVFWIGLLALMVWSQTMAQRHQMVDPATAASTLKVLVAITLIMSVGGGLVQRGLAFQPADVDFLFPGPFTRRQLIVYRLCSVYPLALVSGFFFVLIFGSQVPNRGLAFVGLVIAQTVAVHFQAVAALLAVTLAERVFARLRRVMQVVLTAVAGFGLVLLVLSVFEHGGFAGEVLALMNGPVARVILYPAVAVEQLATARDLAAIVRPLVFLLLVALGSFVLAVSLQVRFFEASLETSKRVARVLALAGRGIPATAGREGERFHERKLPAIPLFRGAGAVLWKNLIVLSRSLRVLIFLLVMAAMVSVWVTIPVRQNLAVGDLMGATEMALGFGGLLPLMVQNHLAFDFRRDLDAFEQLKQLPLDPMGLALAQVALPALLAFSCQLALIVPLIVFLGLPVMTLWLALLVFPLTTLGVCTISNVGFLLFPLRSGTTTSGRPNPGAASLMMVFTAIALMVALLPALITFASVFTAFESRGIALAAAVPVQAIVDVSLLWYLGRLFRKFDLSRE